MKKKPGIPPYNDPADGPLTPEQIAENVRMSVDSLAALNVAFDMDMSAAEAFEFVRKNRRSFELAADALVADQTISDTARIIKAVNSANGIRARSSKKPKILAAWKTGIIDAMRQERLRGGTFDDFLDAAQNDGYDSLEIAEVGVGEFAIVWDEDADPPKRTLGTLKKWWTDAGRKRK